MYEPQPNVAVSTDCAALLQSGNNTQLIRSHDNAVLAVKMKRLEKNMRYSGRRMWVVKSIRNIRLMIRTYGGDLIQSLGAQMYTEAHFEGPRPSHQTLVSPGLFVKVRCQASEAAVGSC